LPETGNAPVALLIAIASRDFLNQREPVFPEIRVAFEQLSPDFNDKD
jgi:hypothetical protein